MLLSSFLLVFSKARNFADLEFCQIFRNPYEKFPALKKKKFRGTSLLVQWWRLTLIVMGLGFMPGQGTRTHMP